MTAPIVREHDGVWVVHDDLYPGGTKARFMPVLFEGVDEAVYASPAEGGAQTALATVAKDLGKRATIFVAARAKLHPRTLEAARLGAKVVPVRPGYLSVVRNAADKLSSLLVVGHNPMIEDVAIACATKGDDAERAALASGFPTSALAVIQFSGPLAEAAPGAGSLTTFLTPAML